MVTVGLQGSIYSGICLNVMHRVRIIFGLIDFRCWYFLEFCFVFASLRVSGYGQNTKN